MLKNSLFDPASSYGTYLYNLGLTLDNDTIKKFENIKYVVMQGSGFRTLDLAKQLAYQLLGIDHNLFEPINLILSSKYVAYKINNILVVSHGMGNASMLTLLHNISKVLYMANNRDLEYIRVGTSGGVGINPGSVVITNKAYMPNLVCGYKISALGKDIIYPTHMDNELNKRIINSQPKNNNINIIVGNTIAADDFYLSQARFDGAIKLKYTPEDRKAYFSKLQKLNIVNFEMESTSLAMFCNRAQIPVTMVASILVNRLETDQISATTDELKQYSFNSQQVALNYIIKHK